MQRDRGRGRACRWAAYRTGAAGRGPHLVLVTLAQAACLPACLPASLPACLAVRSGRPGNVPSPAELAGEPTAQSNSLSLLWDEAPPRPVIRIAGKYATTSSPKVPILVAFGERVMQSNPLGLFNTTGFARSVLGWDALGGQVKCQLTNNR